MKKCPQMLLIIGPNYSRLGLLECRHQFYLQFWNMDFWWPWKDFGRKRLLWMWWKKLQIGKEFTERLQKKTFLGLYKLLFPYTDLLRELGYETIRIIIFPFIMSVCNLSTKSYSFYRRSHNDEKFTVLPIKAPMNMETLFKNIDMITFVASVTYFAVFNIFFWVLWNISWYIYCKYI